MTAKTIMLQGTASNVGKSILATALCRIFAEDSYKVAPFKGWNMALNSYVTQDGGEIGTAQAIQAQAAQVEATVDMQPFLLKPKGDGKSQVIKHGRPLADLGLKEQDEDYRADALKTIKNSLNRLCQQFEIVVLEGAGSPAEINIKKQDLANMNVAKIRKSPVLLVADVDRGGALASVVGTIELLPPKEKKLVAGIILNKFRGDIELLKPGIDIIEEETGIPVLGVIPYFKDFRIPAEDSVALTQLTDQEAEIEIAVIRLPHISNFTDLEPFEQEPNTEVRYINQTDYLGEPDLIIIPGTKNTIDDLVYLKESGLAEQICTAAKNNIPIIGVCGGYQMLGQKIYDPEGTESNWEEIKGLGLLPIETNFSSNKLTFQAEAIIEGGGEFLTDLKESKVEGYEIHMGTSQLLNDNLPAFRIKKRGNDSVNIADGAVSEDGLILGTYLHGIFDNDTFRRNLINTLRQKRGLEPLDEEVKSLKEELESSYNKLADIVRENIDLEKLYEIIK
ncbi:cobyric acid synthase [Selenihalanaerobacter shriftii]|uniref:Cobyric acid synthase n=1 Tax=Selenihalanaerobacter shriftii TaxID=142842 RepID=A0A1T4K4A4_9FIRM|nr:cobyric acid synthase [Selenihalanaerobacter shriftii]SJZ37251.1 adenosylcobyric acid synthase (glutamine-hydrolysing) [Selenihalanaerobacter shriftii]